MKSRGTDEHRIILAHLAAPTAVTPRQTAPGTADPIRTRGDLRVGAARAKMRCVEYVWLVLAVAAMAGLAWVGFRIEPHWVAKDRSRFLCNAQLMTERGDPVGRFRETKILVESNGEMLVDQRRYFKRSMSSWRVVAESETPPKNRSVFVLRGHDPKGVPAMLAVRLPASSPMAPELRELLARR